MDRVTYDDEAPWPTEPDGSNDYTLQRLIATNYGNDVADWDWDSIYWPYSYPEHTARLCQSESAVI